MKNKIKILLTGATGYIGQNLTRHLLLNHDVDILVRPNSNVKLFDDINRKINIFSHDASTSHMIKIIEKSKPNIIIHLASFSLHEHKIEDVENIINSNILFGTQILEAMSINKIKYFINTGTYWQHFENSDFEPTCLYASSKQAFQDILKYYVASSDLKAITLKLFDTYGPNDKRDKIFRVLSNAIYNKKELNLSPGRQLMDMVYITDVVQAYVIAINRIINEDHGKNEDFFISSQKPLKLKTLIEKYMEIINKNIKINWGGRKYRFRESMMPYNIGERLPGWIPKVNIEEGIKMMDENDAK